MTGSRICRMLAATVSMLAAAFPWQGLAQAVVDPELEASCDKRRIAIEVESFGWPGGFNEINKRIAREHKALYEGPCARSIRAKSAIDKANNILNDVPTGYVNAWDQMDRARAEAKAAGKAPGNAPPSAAPRPAGSAVPAGSGHWPVGVQPGNLYIVEETSRSQSINTARGPNGPSTTETSKLLVAAPSAQEAVRVMQDAYERYKRVEEQKAKSMISYTGFFVAYRVVQECNGPNWGAVVQFGVKVGLSCGGRTPEEAILGAARKCAEVAGRPCASRDPNNFLSVSIAHSGREGFNSRDSKYPAAASVWPPRSVTYAALWATTIQSAAEANIPESAEAAILQFGQVCARGERSCWVTSKNFQCIFREVPVNRQSACVDRGLTARGYSK